MSEFIQWKAGRVQTHITSVQGLEGILLLVTKPLWTKLAAGFLTTMVIFFGRALVRTPISGLCLHPPPRSHSSHSNIRLNGQAYNCLIHFYKIAYHDNPQWKMTLDGIQHLIEGDI